MNILSKVRVERAPYSPHMTNEQYIFAAKSGVFVALVLGTWLAIKNAQQLFG